MSKLSFKTFCIEFYSQHINKPSNEVYKLLQDEGIVVWSIATIYLGTLYPRNAGKEKPHLAALRRTVP